MIKTVVILAMPRSGSSLLAGILHRLGVWMGEDEDIKVGKHLNRYGCYENQSFIALNENILFQAKRVVDHSRRLSDDYGLVESVVKSYEGKIKNLIRNDERELWGFKNPTIIYTLPYFHQHLTNPYFICLYRDADIIAHSFLMTARPQNWWPEIQHEFSYFTVLGRIEIIFRFLKLLIRKGNLFKSLSFQKKIAEDGYKRINRFIRDKRHITFKLEDLLNDSKKIIQEIITFLEISPTPGQIKDALSFIDQDLISS
jgi:hypothetical protein